MDRTSSVPMVLDDTLLDDPARLADVDSGGALRAAAMAGAQVRSASERADELAAKLERHEPRALVLITRSAVGDAVARMLAALLDPGAQLPVVFADVVPSWAGPLDVVYAHTDDPGDQELAESLDRACRYGARVVLSAPDEGPVAASVAGRGVHIAPRSELAARRDFAHALTCGLQVAAVLGLVEVDFEVLADELDAEAARDHLGHESFVNPAKSLALRIAERTPLLWGLDPVATSVAGYAAYALATDAAVVSDVSEYRRAVSRTALHRSAVALSNDDDIFADPYEGDDGPAMRVMLLAVRTGAQADATRRAAEHVLTSADVLDANEEIGADEPTRAVALALRFELAALYLGLATGTVGGTGLFAPA
ncbi:SIS domain-containing protein [Haloechinothrix aidingensis]|nr:SIS domain-containing protein [Haloechinothrix aidingensis]